MARKKKQKQDEAHDETDRIIEQTEKKIHTEYAKAEKELKKKVEAFFEKFDAEDEEKRQQLANGEITADYYKKWRTTRMATGQRWEDMRQIIAEDMTNANNLARSTINGHAADVYALNRNFATYQVEKEARINTSFTLYNRRAVERLMVNDERLLPLPKEGSRAWQAMMDKDLRWNQQKINSSLIQGILQGDSIPEISDRLLNIVGMNEVSARRSARTMMTSVENKARDDSYEELKSKGVELETIWLATLDDRTRHSHRQLHGEVRGENGKYSNGLRYPADPAGAPEETYNCRCCEISHVKGYPIDIPKWSPKMGDMTFEEWLGEHEESAPVITFTPAVTKEEAEKYALKFADSVDFKGVSLENANKINEQLTMLTEKYPIDKLEQITGSGSRGVMDASASSLRINGKKLGSVLSEETERYAEIRENNQKMIETYKNRFASGRYPPAIKKQIERLEETLKYQRWGVHSSYNDHVKTTVIHEYGHILSDQYFGMLNTDRANPAYKTNPELSQMNSKWTEAFNRAIKTGDIFSLSEYGRKNVKEFFAESFAAKEMGETLPSYVDDLLTEVLKNGIMR